jgi:uncharacterized membrane protein
MSLLRHLLPGLAAFPDPHPVLVHFPVALFPAALLFSLAALLGRPAWASAAVWLLRLGTGMMIAAAIAGFRAQGSVPHGPGSLAATHRTFMLVSLATAIALSGWTVRRELGVRGRRTLAVGLLILTAAVTLGADRGALLAYRKQAGAGLALPQGVPAKTAMASDSVNTTGDPARGRSLYARLACGTCHDSTRVEEAPGIPPSLAFAGSKLNPPWIRAYLLRPYPIRWRGAEVRPVPRMPDFALSEAEASDLAAFLAGRVDPVRFPETRFARRSFTQARIDSGRALVADYACRGCHWLGGSGNHLGPALDQTGDRLRPSYLFAFLRDPKGIIPGTPMKDFHLWDEEALDLTAYLSSLSSARRVPEARATGGGRSR